MGGIQSILTLFSTVNLKKELLESFVLRVQALLRAVFKLPLYKNIQTITEVQQILGVTKTTHQLVFGRSVGGRA